NQLPILFELTILTALALAGRTYCLPTEAIIGERDRLFSALSAELPDLEEEFSVLRKPPSGNDTATEPSADGQELEQARLETLLVQYQLESWGTGADAERRHRIERILDRCLRREGLGFCEGGELGA